MDANEIANLLRPPQVKQEPTKPEGVLTLEQQMLKVAATPVVDGPPDDTEWTFVLAHTDARGAIWTGTFLHRIPTEADNVTISRAIASQLGGFPIESFSEDDLYRLRRLAHLIVCFPQNVRPAWAKDFGTIRMASVLEALYEKARVHMDFYFRR